MCDYKNLVHTEHGYVVKCTSCMHMHVAYGTTVLRFSQDEFLVFVKDVRRKLETSADIWCRQSKTIQIDTDSKNIMLVYSYKELEQFVLLLDKAVDKLSKEYLFNFAYN